jgi:hypothetical protein
MDQQQNKTNKKEVVSFWGKMRIAQLQIYKNETLAIYFKF